MKTDLQSSACGPGSLASHVRHWTAGLMVPERSSRGPGCREPRTSQDSSHRLGLTQLSGDRLEARLSPQMFILFQLFVLLNGALVVAAD